MTSDDSCTIRVDRCDEGGIQSVLDHIFSLVASGRRRFRIVVRNFDECVEVVRKVSSELFHVSLEVYEESQTPLPRDIYQQDFQNQ